MLPSDARNDKVMSAELCTWKGLHRMATLFELAMIEDSARDIKV